MAATFTVLTTTHFDGMVKKLTKVHPELIDLYARTVSILLTDPYKDLTRKAWWCKLNVSY